MPLRILLCLLMLPALLLCGEASAKDKRDGAPKAAKGAAAGTASELKRWPKPPRPLPCLPPCNDKPGGLPGPYPVRQAR